MQGNEGTSTTSQGVRDATSNRRRSQKVKSGLLGNLEELSASQYFLSGDQILQNALRKQTSRTSADDIATLGGNYATGQGGAAGNLDVPQTAAVVLTLPHNTPSGVGKAFPLPTDLLTQQVQVTVELKPVAAVFGIAASAPSGTLGKIPAGLASAQFQVQQVMLNNQSDALARRVDMAQNAYAFPAEFVQQVQKIPLANSAAPQSAVLTGKLLVCY